MLRAIKDLKGYALLATDGPIGHVVDVLVDDRHWAVRYLVVDTGTWLSGRKVLISPMSLGLPDWALQQLPVSLTKDRVEHSPDVDTQKPVSRQHEEEQLSYYGYPVYWEGTGMWGTGAYPGVLAGTSAIASTSGASTATAVQDPHLRSCDALVGYQILATDGDLGHVENFLLDDESWAVRYFVVDTSNWWGGHHVLIAPQWVDRVSWPDATVTLDLSRDAIKHAPPYDEAKLFERQHEFAMYEHYGRPKYWADEPDDR